MSERAYVITYNTLIRCFVINEKLPISAFLYEDMCEAELVPDSETYNILLQCYVKFGTEENVWAFLKRMHIRPDEEIYNLLIPLYQKKGYLDHNTLTKLVVEKTDLENTSDALDEHA